MTPDEFAKATFRLEKEIVKISTKLDFYQRELLSLHEKIAKVETEALQRISKLESFKSILTAIAMVGPFIGGVVGVLAQRFLL